MKKLLTLLLLSPLAFAEDINLMCIVKNDKNSIRNPAMEVKIDLKNKQSNGLLGIYVAKKKFLKDYQLVQMQMPVMESKDSYIEIAQLLTNNFSEYFFRYRLNRYSGSLEGAIWRKWSKGSYRPEEEDGHPFWFIQADCTPSDKKKLF